MGSLALVCPYCGATVSINLETVGPTYLTYERPESIECYASDCEATWEPNGEQRDAPRWERYPDLYQAPPRAIERADRLDALASRDARLAAAWYEGRAVGVSDDPRIRAEENPYRAALRSDPNEASTDA